MSNRNIRKFIDLVRRVSGKWTNWDPPIPIAVGDYGTLDENGELAVEGNIYKDRAIQKYLDDNEMDLNLAGKENQPEFDEPEQDYIVASPGVKRGELNIDQSVNIPTILSATIKGTWKFQDGKRGALIIIYNPRQTFIPKSVQEKLPKVKSLEGKCIVASALACPAYLMYLSGKYGETFSVAFSPKTTSRKKETNSPDEYEYVWEEIYPPWGKLDEDGEETEDSIPPFLSGKDKVGETSIASSATATGVDVINGEAVAGWWTNNETAFLRRGFDPNGEYRFTPLFSLKQRAKPSWAVWRGEDETNSSEEYIWQDVYEPWKPLDEDGKEFED